MNRLKANMINKIEVIDGAISMCYRLIRGETIELKGLHSYSITRGSLTDKELQQRIQDLYGERDNLQERVNRFNS